ncbi:unnamed protein product [Echinostoma caproni]|uniref:SH3 domain-containing protein n=1 Tax=Echinostoma caproni TaxID=27848 RepID=A0A183AVG2_9TREM|nr:unnamed protein product [Echinostoma caproni]
MRSRIFPSSHFWLDEMTIRAQTNYEDSRNDRAFGAMRSLMRRRNSWKSKEPLPNRFLDRYEQLGGDRSLNEAQSKLGKMQQDLNNAEPNKSVISLRSQQGLLLRSSSPVRYFSMTMSHCFGLSIDSQTKPVYVVLCLADAFSTVYGATFLPPPHISAWLSAYRSVYQVVFYGEAVLKKFIKNRTDDFDSDGSFDSEPEGAVDVNDGLASAEQPTANSPSSSFVGYAKVKYEYEGNGSTYLAAKPGEMFYVRELDSSNSGWTSVVSQDGTRHGFVPTSFIDVTLY